MRDALRRTAVGIGEIAVSADAEERLCIFGLGSCVALYLFAPGSPAVGVAHVVLPQSAGRDGKVGRFADTALPALVAEMRSLGVAPSELRAAITGGANVLGFGTEIGQQNVAAVRMGLAHLEIPIVQDDTGGRRGRSVEFDPLRQEIAVRVLSSPQVSI